MIKRQSILIGAAIGGELGGLLGRGVGRRAGETPVVLTVELPGETQVEDLELALFGGADILGLQVAVHDPPAVREVERLGERANDQPHLVERQPASPLEQRREVARLRYTRRL